jgi:hypothetical protein
MPTRKKHLLVALLAALFACSAFAEEPGFVGNWQGDFKGKPFLAMTVAEGTPLRIKFVTADVHVNGDGEIEEVNGSVENEEKVIEAKVDGRKLRFKTTQDNGDVMEYEMRLTGDGAELVILSADIEVKPWPLRRV